MWDDHDRDDPADETAGSPARRRKEEPLDLPLGPPSGPVRPAPSAAPLPLPPPPPVAPPKRKKDAAPLFPDWAPDGTASPPRDFGSPRGASPVPPPALVSFADEPGEADPGPGSAPLAARAFAGIVDLALAILVGAILVLSVRVAVGTSLPRATIAFAIAFAVELSLVAAILSQFLFGKTPGMALAAIRAEEPDGMPIRFRRAVVRVLASLGGVLLPGVGLLVAAIRDDRCSLTDLLSGTVLRESDLATGPAAPPDDDPFGR